MLLLFAAAIAPLPTELGSAWAEFSRRPALRRAIDKIEIGTLGRDRSSGNLRYWVRYTRTEGARKTVRWADSATCSDVRAALESMRKLPAPHPAPYGVGNDNEADIILDGVGYYLRTPAMFPGQRGELTMRSNIGTPLAQWVEQSLERLDGCWTAQAPRRSE